MSNNNLFPDFFNDNESGQNTSLFPTNFRGTGDEDNTPVQHANLNEFLEVSDVLFNQEDKVVDFLNSKYDGQNVRFAFSQGDFKDEIEVLVGDQEEGEGEKFSLAFGKDDNTRIFNDITTHIDNYTRSTASTENTEEWQDLESNLRNSLDQNIGKYYSEENIEKEFTKLLKPFVDEDGGGWKVKRAGAGNYIVLTSPGGVESKPFYVGGKYGMHEYGKDENTDVTKEKIIEFIKRNPTKNKNVVDQEEDFRMFLFQPEIRDENSGEITQEAGYFTPDKIKEITGKEFLRGVESKKDFVKKVKEDMGIGRFFDEKDNENRNRFNLLTNSRLDEIIGDVFNSIQTQEQTEFLNGLATKSLDDIEADIERQGYSEFDGEKFKNVDQFHDIYRKNIIKLFDREEDRELAEANMELKYNKNLSTEEIN